MTALVAAVAAQITALDATLVAGTNLFAGRAPETPDRAVTIFQYAGQGPDEVMGAGTSLDMPRIRLICRAARDDYGQADTDAKLLHDGLDQYAVTWSGISILRCIPISVPEGIGTDDAERPMISVRFEIVTAR